MTDHPLKLYNSLTREVETFVPQDPARVTMYGCGPTVYSYAHIGNARAAVVADVLFRVLRHIYGEDAVEYARNLTDVDDKIIAAATEQGVPISDITERYARIYNEDLAALNCLPPTHQPKATEHIQGMADLIVTLLDKNTAYESEGHVYFDTSKDADYGKLSGRRPEDNLAGARVEVAGAKRNAADFVLWKPAKEGEPGWSQQESSDTYAVSWGRYSDRPFAVVPGRPGWHIECSAMAKACLGDTIDIHTGGIDLLFPHHENEIAQSETANEKPFARHWVHNEFLNMGREKMSKSEGNVVLVHDLLKSWDGEVIRLALLKAHYRKELSWSEDLLRESKAQLDGWYRKLKTALDWNGRREGYDGQHDFSIVWEDAGLEKVSLVNDLDVAATFREVMAMIDDVLRLQDDIISNRPPKGEQENWYASAEARRIYWTESAEFGWNHLRGVLHAVGLLQRDPEDWFRGNASTEDTARFDALASARHAARTAKDWTEADRIRDKGRAAGIVFEDGPDGTTWRRG